MSGNSHALLTTLGIGYLAVWLSWSPHVLSQGYMPNVV